MIQYYQLNRNEGLYHPARSHTAHGIHPAAPAAPPPPAQYSAVPQSIFYPQLEMYPPYISDPVIQCLNQDMFHPIYSSRPQDNSPALAGHFAAQYPPVMSIAPQNAQMPYYGMYPVNAPMFGMPVYDHDQHNSILYQNCGDVSKRVQNTNAPDNTSKGCGVVKGELEYDIQIMAEYVSTMACVILKSDADTTPAYREFISQVLGATRLPISTIFLSLYFLSQRSHKPGLVIADPTSIYKLSVVALILANKVNDDNTFTNKSWSDVTGLLLSELTAMEASWLALMDYKMAVDQKVCESYKRWNFYYQEWFASRIATTQSAAQHFVADERDESFSKSSVSTSPEASMIPGGNVTSYSEPCGVPLSASHSLPGVTPNHYKELISNGDQSGRLAEVPFYHTSYEEPFGHYFHHYNPLCSCVQCTAFRPQPVHATRAY
ncbi:hypothetical protein CANCADRAFT_89256 [Tortispora caseinolytica NRRL Y-17796]|uniref:Cyclin N-terminal domain-containing protein n=1 Tax=Tortispora caseinolytica NRRL Y-17796 TaxID=767744 RepID=A0A1E4TLR5_9ASCO|nr:hypothetical protein CANCADRAFT_89256 [Tortispora caseinolytica NRRL Y-17796]